MIIIDEKLLDQHRGAGPCDWCKKPFLRREPHHLHRRGMGGGHRLDISCNIAALCRGCHESAEAGRITREDMLALVAQREGVHQRDMERALSFFNHADKGNDREALQRKANMYLHGAALGLVLLAIEGMA